MLAFSLSFVMTTFSDLKHVICPNGLPRNRFTISHTCLEFALWSSFETNSCHFVTCLSRIRVLVSTFSWLKVCLSWSVLFFRYFFLACSRALTAMDNSLSHQGGGACCHRFRSGFGDSLFTDVFKNVCESLRNIVNGRVLDHFQFFSTQSFKTVLAVCLVKSPFLFAAVPVVSYLAWKVVITGRWSLPHEFSRARHSAPTPNAGVANAKSGEYGVEAIVASFSFKTTNSLSVSNVSNCLPRSSSLELHSV